MNRLGWWLCVLFVSLVGPVWAQFTEPSPPADAAHPQLVQDTEFGVTLPGRYRSSVDMLLTAGNLAIPTAGLENLRISGSAAPSVDGINWILFEANGPAVIVDLRQEPHGFLNGAGITWYATNDWACCGMSRGQSLDVESDKLDWLRAQSVVDLVRADDAKEGAAGNTHYSVEVREVASEREAVERLGADYFRLTVTDHLRPRDVDVDRFVDFLRGLPQDVWVHFHCRGGMGRTTTFMVLYDSWRNADKVSFADIVKRQTCVEPKYDLLVERPDSSKALFRKERADFVARFYDFARDVKAGYDGNWSDWISSHPAKGSP